jgi:uncharacterized protein (DUF433 family)
VGNQSRGFIMRKLSVFALMLLASSASAANLALKAPVFTTPICSVTSCIGGFIGMTVGNGGGNIDIIGSGVSGLTQNGLAIGMQGGYEYFNNSIYFAPYVNVNYDISLSSVSNSIADKTSYGGGIRVGYSLAGIFGTVTTQGTTPSLPTQLLNSLMTPYINVNEEKRHGQPALGTGVGVEALLAADATGHSSWTLNADYLHYTYNQGGNAGSSAGLTTTQKDENWVGISLNRHFGF